jgi:electron transfer flavoprotein beta subunit
VAINCVVCVKQVPDTKRITGQAMKEDGTVNRAALPTIFNPEDLNALETALEIRDRLGGTVAVVSMGPAAACEVLRCSLFLGADRAVLLTDRRAAASDTLATSYILACAVRKFSPNVVLCGRQAIDGDTAQVGPQLAEKLHMPVISYVEELMDIDEQRIRAKRNVGNGWEAVECRLPVLLTVMETANVPRPPAIKRVMKYKKARSASEIAREVDAAMAGASDADKATEARRRSDDLAAAGLLIEQWTLDDIGADLAWCGRDGSPTKVHRIQSVVLAGGAYREFPPTAEGAATLIGELIDDHTIG